MRRSYIVRRYQSTKIDIRCEKNLLLRWGGVHENPQHCGPPHPQTTLHNSFHY